MTPTELKTEIQTGPHATTLAPFVAAGNDRAIVDFLNDLNGPGAALITLSSIPRQRVLRVFLRVAIDLDAKTAALKSKWDRILPFIHDMEDIPPVVLDEVLTLAVNDGLLTTVKANSIKTRIGSRAEVLWGQSITINDVSETRRV